MKLSEKTKQEKCLTLCIAGEKNTVFLINSEKGVQYHGHFWYTFFLLNSEKLCDKNDVNYTKLRFSGSYLN